MSIYDLNTLSKDVQCKGDPSPVLWVTLENETLVYVSFENTQVEFHNTYISYVLLSLIGEVGGILGLTLGASVMTSLDFILQKLPYY